MLHLDCILCRFVTSYDRTCYNLIRNVSLICKIFKFSLRFRDPIYSGISKGAIIRLNTLICKLFRRKAGKAPEQRRKPVDTEGLNLLGNVVGHKESMAEMEESMKKKKFDRSDCDGKYDHGRLWTKTATSVSEDPTVSEAPMKEDTLEPEESAEDATQSAEESQEATDSSSTSSNATKESNKATESNTASGSSNTSGEGNTATDNSGLTNNNTASPAGKDTQTVSESTEDTQPTGVQTKYKMYDGVYFDEVIYTLFMDDSQVRPYCEINVSNATDTSFDFTIYDVDGQNRSLKFKNTYSSIYGRWNTGGI